MNVPPIFSRTAKKQDSATQELAKGYQKQIANIGRDLVKSVLSQRGKDGKLAQSAASAKFIRGLLKKSSPLAKDIDQFLSASGDAALDSMSGLPYSEELTMPSKAGVKAALRASYKDITKGMGKVSRLLERQLKTEIAAMTLIPKDPKQVAKRIQQAYALPFSSAQALLQTGLAAAQRDVQSEVVKSLPKDERCMLYMGPDDATTRPFCRALVGQVVMAKDLRKLKNGQRGASNVERYCGGYNCRHRWTPITLSYAESRGLKPLTDSEISRINAEAAG